MLGVGIIAPLLPIYAEGMGATGLWIGLIFSGFSITRAIFMPLFGRLSDVKGRRIFLLSGLFLYSVLSLGYIWAWNTISLFAIRLAHGVAAGMVIPIAQAAVGDIAPKGEEGRWMGYFNASFFMGFGIGPLLGGFLTDIFGMNSAFYAMGILNFIAFLLILFMLPKAKPKREPPSSGILKSNISRAVFGFRVAFASGRGIFFTFLPLAASVAGIGPGRIGLILSLNIILMSLSQGLGGRLADIMDRKLLIILGGLLTALFFLAIPFAGSFIPFLLISALGGIGGALCLPSASALMIEEGRTYGMGSSMSLFNISMSIGIGMGPILGGVVKDAVNLDSVFYMASFLMLIGVFLFFLIIRKT